ncbi:unnamed protein product [Caenorhabditis auriculariae]|uniref:PHD finger protein 14 n=1 Tax=Caenorhabditis auriculariae TaxID=2777116 RepID=A0A8S1GVN3_9PELO|nr:unnamed protein product [Caenorhabditis auriculariae]
MIDQIGTRMSEAEKKSFFEHARTRAPGKRQVKPTAAVLLDLDLPPDEEDDDEEFVADDGSQESDGSSSESSTEGDGDEDEEEEEKEGDEKKDIEELATETVAESSVPICSICLNQRPSLANDEVMHCDKCGVAVHEACYGGDHTGSHSEDSDDDSPTELWFCEACVYGLREPPFCEFCPSRYGAFKRSDVGGRWVHPLCAFYTPSATFGDIDKYSAISWQEMDHRLFGKKPCSACTNKLEARTGITIRCEIGLCKEHFHVSCAQRLGYLVDHSEMEEKATSNEAPVSQYVTCKRHSNSDNAKALRTAYAKWFIQEERRLTVARRKVLTEREERKRLEYFEKSQQNFKSLESVTICWPKETWGRPERARRSRHLHTSPRYLNAFKEKAELANIDEEHFEQEFLRLDVESLPFLSPGFSREFVDYFFHRENHVVLQEKKKLEMLRKSIQTLKDRKFSREADNEKKQLEAQAAESAEDLEDSCALLTRFYNVLQLVGVKRINKPSIVQSKQSSPPSKKMKLSKSVTPPASSAKNSSVEANGAVHNCAECNKTHDQHLMTNCDECLKYYHIGCLDPPLERLPKRTANIGWVCHQCDTDNEDEEAVEDETSNDGPRKLRQRSDTLKIKKNAEIQEQNRAFREAVRRSKLDYKPPTKKPKKQSATPRSLSRKTAHSDDDEPEL